MRVSFAALLMLGLIAVVQCAEVGTEDNPYPEDHDGIEDADDAEDGGDGGDEDQKDDDGDDDDASDGQDPEADLKHYEDNGEGDTLTADTLRELHKKLDHNKDGKVHIDEIMKFADASRKATARKEIHGIFDEIDSTKDGSLSLEEHLSEMAEFHEGDDAEKELQKDHETRKFKAADSNGDGELDKEEIVAMLHPHTHEEVMELHVQEEMRKKDTNKDGKLSSKEWTPEASEHKVLAGEEDKHDGEADFANLDADKDGFISMDELRHFESGRYHTEDAMKKLLELADHDGDNHMTVNEFTSIVSKIDGHDAHPHLMDWAFHDEM